MIPDGYYLVPLEPTEEMMEAVECGGERRDWPSGRMRVASWRAMVAAGALAVPLDAPLAMSAAPLDPVRLAFIRAELAELRERYADAVDLVRALVQQQGGAVTLSRAVLAHSGAKRVHAEHGRDTVVLVLVDVDAGSRPG